MLVKTVEKLEPQYIVGGNVIWCNYSGEKHNEVLTHAVTWKHTLNQGSQLQKLIYCMIPFIGYDQNSQSTD